MFKISLNRVRDEIVIKEGDQELPLSVDSDANSLVMRLKEAQKPMLSVNADTTDEDKAKAARNLAAAIFGNDQAEKLIDFYHGNPGSVAEICGRYFENRLAKKITKAQIKAGNHEIRLWKHQQKRGR